MQGGAFCGKFTAPEPEFSYGFRGRMDERYDLVRGVRDKRFMYVRNFMPHIPHGQHNGYQFATPTTRVWKQLFDAGKLTPEQLQFWQTPKAVEELYDLTTDRDEVHNLAGDAGQQDRLQRMRGALAEWVHRTHDTGFLPECEMLSRSNGSTPYDMGHDPSKYDCGGIYAAATLATSLKTDDLPQIIKMLASRDSGIRYWGALGILSQGKPAVAASHDKLVAALQDSSPIVRVTAAEALGKYGNHTDITRALDVLLQSVAPENDAYLSTAAWNTLDHLGDNARPAANAFRQVSPEPINMPARYGDYSRRLKPYILSRFAD
jgi:uncharacterized sulfatase